MIVPILKKLVVLLFPVVWVVAGGCISLDAYHARFHEPNYMVTPSFYETPPDRVAVLPFASSRHEQYERSAVCRKIFYQHFGLLEFANVNINKIDRILAQLEQTDDSQEDVTRKPAFAKPLTHMFRLFKKIDVVGMTSVVDVPSLLRQQESIDYDVFRTAVGKLREDLGADAYVFGIVRGYGRFYAVIASSIGLSVRIELRAGDTGALLWRGEMKKRNFNIPISLNPIDIPYLLFYTWQNSRGAAMDMLAYTVFRDLVNTIPSVTEPVDVAVHTLRKRTPWFARPTVWRIRRKGRLPAGEVMPFQMELRGWFLCDHPEHGSIWIPRKYAALVDGRGNLLR